MEESAIAFDPSDCPRCVNSATIVVSRIEVGVVVLALQL